MLQNSRDSLLLLFLYCVFIVLLLLFCVVALLLFGVREQKGFISVFLIFFCGGGGTGIGDRLPTGRREGSVGCEQSRG